MPLDRHHGYRRVHPDAYWGELPTGLSSFGYIGQWEPDLTARLVNQEGEQWVTEAD